MSTPSGDGRAATPGAVETGGRRAVSVPWVGRSVRRVEDPPGLLGAATYVGDLFPPDLLHLAFVRSPYARAHIVGIDTEEAAAMSGVEAVYTAADLGLGDLEPVLHREGFVPVSTPLLAGAEVHHVGEPVAAVVASSGYLAEDAAQAVWVDYEPRPAVASLEAALSPDPPVVHDHLAVNVVVDAAVSGGDPLDNALAGADRVVEASFRSGRLAAAPLEGRGALAEWDAAHGRLVLHASTQVPHLLRTVVADILGLGEHRVRVITPDVGGGFGLKCVIGREELVAAALGLRLRRPVRWVETRRENLGAGFHGHEQEHDVRAGFDAEGRLLGLETDIRCDVGAYHCYPFTAGVEPLMAASEMPGPYTLPRYRARARAVMTNKAPMAPYRGVSRPQITYVMERLMDKAARRLEIDPVEIRRRNLITPDAFPYRGVTGIVYDEGSYLESLEVAAAALGVEELRDRQARAREEGRLLGMGLSCFSERTAYGTEVFAQRGMGVTPGFETAEIRMDPSGRVTAALGTSAHGQGHVTTIGQIIADELGIDPSWIRIVQGDTDTTPYGWGTFASRTVVLSGDAARDAARALAATLVEIGAHLLEAAPDDMVLTDGAVAVRGQPGASIPIEEVARTAHHSVHRLPDGVSTRLFHSAVSDPSGTFSNATHACEVEVDASTGTVSINRYVVVEDCGVMINPMIVEGQIRGGVAQGLAAALYEELVYDDNATPLSTTFADYLIPTAVDVPKIEIHHLETPSTVSATGAKGMGEGGLIGAPAAIANAVNDALAPLGIEIDVLPITPSRIRAAIERVR